MYVHPKRFRRFSNQFARPQRIFCYIQRNVTYKGHLKAIKIILNYEYTDIASSMNEIKILNIFEIIFPRKAKFMYKSSKSITPSYINETFTIRTVNETLLSLRSVNT